MAHENSIKVYLNDTTKIWTAVLGDERSNALVAQGRNGLEALKRLLWMTERCKWDFENKKSLNTSAKAAAKQIIDGKEHILQDDTEGP